MDAETPKLMLMPTLIRYRHMDRPYPNGHTVRRTVSIGGLRPSELIDELAKNAISLNAMAEQILTSARFTTSEHRYTLATLELTVRDLGFPRGATIVEIHARATERGLGPCPLELGPHLRLQYPDQPEGHRGQPVHQNRAPYGSITVASAPLTDDDDFPRGFYLRRIDDVLWLRGYRSDDQHVWDANDHFVFAQDDA